MNQTTRKRDLKRASKDQQKYQKTLQQNSDLSTIINIFDGKNKTINSFTFEHKLQEGNISKKVRDFYEKTLDQIEFKSLYGVTELIHGQKYMPVRIWKDKIDNSIKRVEVLQTWQQKDLDKDLIKTHLEENQSTQLAIYKPDFESGQ